MKTSNPLYDALAQKGLSIEDLATGTGLKIGTIRNIACGSSESRSARQKITNYLKGPVFPGILPNEIAFVMPVGEEIPVTDEISAQQWLNEFPGRMERRGSVLVFTKRTALVVRKPTPDLDDETIGVPESLSSDDLDAKYGSANEAGANETR